MNLAFALIADKNKIPPKQNFKLKVGDKEIFVPINILSFKDIKNIRFKLHKVVDDFLDEVEKTFKE